MDVETVITSLISCTLPLLSYTGRPQNWQGRILADLLVRTRTLAVSKRSGLSDGVLNGLPWQSGYSHVLGKNEEFIADATSIPEAKELLTLLQRRLKGTSLNESVTLGSHEYMLVHHTILRVPLCATVPES